MSSSSINSINVSEVHQASYFDGSLAPYIGWKILGFLVIPITLGLAYPWIMCKLYAWRINHTIIKGQRLMFFGQASDLLAHWIIWFLLCIVTLGIYSFWLVVNLEKWRVRHTKFE